MPSWRRSARSRRVEGFSLCQPHRLAALAAEFQRIFKLRSAGWANEPSGRDDDLRSGGRRGRNDSSSSLQTVDLRQHTSQLLLQIFLGALIILVGQFAQAIFELQVTEIFVNRRLALIQVLEG